MKKLSLTMLSFLFAFCSWATEIPMSVTPPGHQGDITPHHAPALLPSADYDDGVLTIYSPYAIEDMTIIIKDADGVVFYSTMVDVSSTAIIALPSGILGSMATLEIIYGDHHLYGEF
ncbi:MAG: DUF3244 domain-containing protein [Paludibacteraceae bacterium]|nr:DUF3244 domain-containing protein [Paludibacteraceae bacterium]